MLETKSIVKKFSNVKALDNVSFNIEAGEIYALLGANGSGKTTWMKIAASLTKASSGEVLYNGKPVGIESRKEIAYMSTEPYFYSWMSVKDVGNYYKDFFEDFSMEKYHELLERMDLEENLKVKNLSSGMVAKLKIAVTMARNAKIYLLDEPLNGIDLIARDTIMETIIERMREDVAIVLSSHLVEEIESFVGKAIFIHKGKVMDMCDVESLRDNDGKSLVDRYREIMK